MATIITITIPDVMEARYLAAAQTLGVPTIQAALEVQMNGFLIQYEASVSQTKQAQQTGADISANPITIQ